MKVNIVKKKKRNYDESVGLCPVDFKSSKISLETFPELNQGQTSLKPYDTTKL
jgi:hypothetical protein